MSKRILLVLLFITTLIIIIAAKAPITKAASDYYCTGGGWSVDPVPSSKCKANGYDCDNVQEVTDKAGCDALGGCYEESYWSMSVYNACYFKNEPSASPSISCGIIGLECCSTVPQCTTGTPFLDTSDLTERKCYCKEPSPSSSPVITSGCSPKGDKKCDSYECVVNGYYYCCETSGQCKNLKENNKETKNKLNILCDSGSGVKTAIGCLNVLTDTNTFASQIIGWAIGIGGGIAFLLMLYAGFMIMTAQGNPERLKAGQELLTSAIAGVILLIFSVFILKFIGIDILGLNKFGFGT